MRDSEPHKEGYDLTLPSHYQINENLDPLFFFFFTTIFEVSKYDEGLIVL